MSEAIHDWDGWLNRLVEEDAARKLARLAEVAVDVMIESTRKFNFGQAERRRASRTAMPSPRPYSARFTWPV
jgi:hypothetical protein